MRRPSNLALTVALAVFAVSCGDDTDPDQNFPTVPDSGIQSNPALGADSGVAPRLDAGLPAYDAGPTSVWDAGFDAGLGFDAGFDSGPGQGTPVTHDAGSDAGIQRDAEVEADAGVDAGEGGASHAAVPSAGCGKSGRPSSGRVSRSDQNYTFPAAYDGKTPLPLFIGFHAYSNPIDQIEKLTNGSGIEQQYVRAFPKSKGQGWDYQADIGHVLAMFDDLTSNYCIDKSRVFASGHSSGAQFIMQILTPQNSQDADKLNFLGVAPVAASHYGKVSRAIPVMYIQAQNDSVRKSNGADVVKDFTTANHCMTGTMPYTKAPTCMSSGKTVKDNCIQYDGCDAPTVWCSHDDPQYSNTYHGWPCFASRAMFDFFESL